MQLTKLKTHLKTIVGTPSVHFKWSEEHNQKLLEYIYEHFEQTSLADKEIQECIKKTLKEHFENIGYTLFKITPDRLRLKLFPYKTEPQDSINLDALIDMIDVHEEHIEYNYNNKEDLVCLKKELALKLIHFVNNITNEEINKKELLKYAVRKAFELNESDIVILKKSQIFIKLFDLESVRPIKENEKNTIASRYNGLDEEELASFYKNFFLKEEKKNFFTYVAEEFVDVYLLEKKIDNFTYEKYAFSLIQSIISQHLESSFDHNENFFKGFSGYIFRIHFKEVFGYIADLLLIEMAASNNYIIEFLKYYSLNIVVLGGKKYKVPELIAANGLKWNIASMMSIVKIYVKSEISLERLKEQEEKFIKELSRFFVGDLSPVEFNNKINKEIEKIAQTLIYANKKLNIYIDSHDTSKNEEEKKSLKKDIQKIKNEIREQTNQKNKLTSKMIHNKELLQYNNLKKEIDSIKRLEKREEKILTQNKEAYLSIKNSLVKALTSKKALLKEQA